jgi:hypothetical protein
MLKSHDQPIGKKACEALSMARSFNLSSFNNFVETMNPQTIVTMVTLQSMLDKEREKNELKSAESVDLFYKKANKRES